MIRARKPKASRMKRSERIVGAVLIAVIGAKCSTATARVETDTFDKHVVVSQEGHASDVGRDVLRGRQCGRCGHRDRIRPGGDAARGGQPGWRRLHRGFPGRSERSGHGRFSGDVAAGLERADVPGSRRETPAAIPDRSLVRRSTRHGPRPGAGPCPVGETSLGRAGPAGRPAGTRRFRHLRRPGRLIEPSVGPERRTKRPRPDEMISVDWAITPSPFRHSASPTGPPGIPATGWFSPIWPPHWNGSRRPDRTSSTAAGPHSSSPTTWARMAGSSPSMT